MKGENVENSESMLPLFTDKSKNNRLINRLIHSYRLLVLHVIRRYLDIPSDVEDAESRVWNEVVFVINRFEALDENDKKNLLCTIARRRAIDVYRERVRNDYEPIDNVADYLTDHSDNDLAERIAFAFSSLSSNDREFLLLRYKYGYSVSEMSKLFKCKKLAMYKRIDRAKERLATVLAEDGIDV